MKKVILRRCVATNKQFEKSEMFRIVRDKDGNVFIDESGKANGRGAYLSKDKSAIELAKKKRILDRVLECEVKEEIYLKLLELL